MEAPKALRRRHRRRLIRLHHRTIINSSIISFASATSIHLPKIKIRRPRCCRTSSAPSLEGEAGGGFAVLTSSLGVIVAILTVLDRVGDVFISWVPMYGEMKLALIIYLWYPKTKDLRPFIVRHETDIERSLKAFRDRAWDVAIYYWQNSTELGQSKFFDIFQHLISKPSSSTQSSQVMQKHQTSGDGRPRPPLMTPSPGSYGSEQGDERWAPTAPPMPTTSHHGHKEPVWLRFRRSRGALIHKKQPSLAQIVKKQEHQNCFINQILLLERN